MTSTRQEAYEALASWKPASVFLESYSKKKLPEHVDIFFGPPEEMFLNPEIPHAYTENRLIPILDDGDFGIVTFHDPDNCILVQIDIEEPEVPVAKFDYWQQYLASVMLSVGESIDEDDSIQRIADLIEFQYMDRLRGLWKRIEELPYDEFESACEEFVSDLSDVK